MVLAYDDPQRVQGKRVRLDGGRISGLRLAGSGIASDWLKALWQSGETDADLRRKLLAPPGAQPVAAADKTLCNCMNVSHSRVCAGIAQGLDLDGLKRELGCGTQCGSCVPEIKRLLASETGSLAVHA